MDLLASIFAYLATVVGIIVAIALSYNSLMLYAPHMPQATAVVAKSSTAKTPKPKAMRKAEIGHAPRHVNRSSADEAKTRLAEPESRAKLRSRHLANDRSRRRLAHGPHSSPKEWAYRPVPRAPYALGYADVPPDRFGNSGFE